MSPSGDLCDTSLDYCHEYHIVCVYWRLTSICSPLHIYVQDPLALEWKEKTTSGVLYTWKCCMDDVFSSQEVCPDSPDKKPVGFILVKKSSVG